MMWQLKNQAEKAAAAGRRSLKDKGNFRLGALAGRRDDAVITP
jgi:hypothetical protein